jgi:hypothetical protein
MWVSATQPSSRRRVFPCSVPRGARRPGYFEIPTLGSPPAIMVEPTKDGNGLDATEHLRWARNRLLLGEPLVRARLVVEAREFDDEKPQMPFTAAWTIVRRFRSRIKRMKISRNRGCLSARPHWTTFLPVTAPLQSGSAIVAVRRRVLGRGADTRVPGPQQIVQPGIGQLRTANRAKRRLYTSRWRVSPRAMLRSSLSDGYEGSLHLILGNHPEISRCEPIIPPCDSYQYHLPDGEDRCAF